MQQYLTGNGRGSKNIYRKCESTERLDRAGRSGCRCAVGVGVYKGEQTVSPGVGVRGDREEWLE